MNHDPLQLDTSAALTTAHLPPGVVLLSPLDARVLRAVDPFYIRSVERVAKLAGCGEQLAASALKRLRRRMLIEDDGCRPMGWLRTHRGELFLEHQP
jgi:hypothetical protein